MRWVVCFVAWFATSLALAEPPPSPSPDLARLLSDEVSILDALDRTIFEIRRAEQNLRNATEALKRLEARQAAALQGLAAARAREAEARARLRVTLMTIAATRAPDPLSAVLFGADGADREAQRVALLQRLSMRQAREWHSLTEAVEAAIVVEFVAAMEVANAHAVAQAVQEARSRLETEAQARREILEALERDRRLAMRHAGEVAAAQRDLIRILQARLSNSPGPVDFERLRGRLRWPLAGARVVVPYGDVVHPRFKTATPHPGVTLAFPSGQERNVRAVAFGRVAFVGRMRGYGNTVVVDHASGFYTVYGGLSEVEVTEGAIVHEGDILGRVKRVPGDDDIRLYFELRRGREALDPVPYLSTQGPKR